MQGGVELAVARAVEPDAAGGVARPHRDGSHTAAAGEGGLVFEPGHPGGFGDEFGRGQLAAARHCQQRWAHLADTLTDPGSQRVDGLGQADHVGEFVAGQLGQQTWLGVQPGAQQRAGFLAVQRGQRRLGSGIELMDTLT